MCRSATHIPAPQAAAHGWSLLASPGRRTACRIGYNNQTRAARPPSTTSTRLNLISLKKLPGNPARSPQRSHEPIPGLSTQLSLQNASYASLSCKRGAGGERTALTSEAHKRADLAGRQGRMPYTAMPYTQVTRSTSTDLYRSGVTYLIAQAMSCSVQSTRSRTLTARGRLARRRIEAGWDACGSQMAAGSHGATWRMPELMVRAAWHA